MSHLVGIEQAHAGQQRAQIKTIALLALDIRLIIPISRIVVTDHIA